jgi:hypothetical protein
MAASVAMQTSLPPLIDRSSDTVKRGGKEQQLVPCPAASPEAALKMLQNFLETQNAVNIGG